MSIAPKPSELSVEEKRALAARLLREKAGRPKAFPLSFAQLRLWLLDQLDPESAANNLFGAVRMRGQLDVAALEQSLNAIVQRHEVLRTTFALVDGQPTQLIAPAQPVALSRYDLQDVAAEAQRAEMQQLLNTQALQAFDLARGPLLHTALLRLGPQDHILSLTLHHIIGDAWSVGVFVRELVECYTAFAQGRPPTLAPLPIQYVDFALWQRQESENVLATQLGYWKERLAGAPPPLELPSDYPRPAIPDFSGAQELLTLPAAQVAALKELCQTEQITLFMTLLAAFQLLLLRWTGQPDVVIGSAIANRNQVEIEGLIGFFVNVLVLRSDLAGNPSFRELLQRVRAVCLGAYAHQDLPFEKLVEELQPERAPGRNPLFEVVLDYINTPQPSFELPGLAISTESTEVVSKYALTLYVNEHESGITLRLLYQRALYSAERMASFLQQLAFLLEQIVAAPERPIGDYSLVTPAAARLLPDPRAALPEPFYLALPQQFAAWAAQTPQQPALRQGARVWTYAELSERVAQLAQTLLSQGLTPGERVAVLGARSFGLIAAMLAVFASRGVLLMIDPSLPLKRQRLMLEQAGARRLLYVASGPPLQEALPELSADAVTLVDAQTGQPTSHGASPSQPVIALPPPAPNDPAYIFFTSGTTGMPKGVLGSHKGLAHFLTWQRTTFAVGPQDRCAQLTALSFDVVLRDICLPLTSGATLCLPDEVDDLGPDQLWPWLEREAITIMHSVPTLAQAWLEQVSAGVALPALRLVFFAGEPLTETLVRRWRTAFPTSGQIVNLYGPTETTLAKCAYVLPDQLTPGIQPVGWPLPETQALVLNQSNQLCGPIELGQIVIRTPFRTQGYINADAEQQRAFVQNPFRDDEQDILYYTGDQGRYRLDGALEVLGRLDQQVKIRGVRVELDEVTAALRVHTAVSACVVVAHQNAQGQLSLVAYVVPDETLNAERRTMNEPDRSSSAFSVQRSAFVSELRAFLAERLPDYMIPRAFVLLDALPLTPNGKLDRRALPPPEADAPTSGAVAPRTPLEEVLVGIWAELLEKDAGIHDNFFDLGGHSLLATQLIARLRDAFQLKLRLRGFYEAPTVAGLAALMLQDPAERERVEQTAQMLLTLSQLSDEEVAAMLESMRQQQGLAAVVRDAAGDAAANDDVAAVAGAAAPPVSASAPPPVVATPPAARQQMAFGLMFFASVDQQTPAANKYRLLLDAARFADEQGFSCIWTPERHFHGFGGLFPNPAVVSAALATITRRLQLRAGSVISPLHNTLRIAEEWAVVDNLSDGRAAVSFGAGWNVDDFLFYPERFSQRHAVMFEQIEQIRQLWRGEAVTLVNSFGKAIDVRIYPQPIQPELPIWITSSSSTQNFVSAGAMGANVLTHLIGQDLPTLADKIQLYREARARHNHDPQQGTITVMLHTYLGPDDAAVKATVRAPFRDYLRSAISLEEKAAIGGGTISGGHKIDPHDIPADMMEDLLDLTFERYFHEAALMGTPATCNQFVQRLRAIGVDEIACLLDFGIEAAAVMRSLEYLDALRSSWSGSSPHEM